MRGKPVAMTESALSIHELRLAARERRVSMFVRVLRKPHNLRGQFPVYQAVSAIRRQNGSALARVAILGSTHTARDIVCTRN
jgi:hypothetical protein